MKWNGIYFVKIKKNSGQKVGYINLYIKKHLKSSKKIDEGMEKVSKTVLMWPSYNKNKNVEFFCASHWRKTLCIIQMLVMKCAQMYKNMHFLFIVN